MPELIDDKIVVALAKSGASNREIEAAIGHGIDSEERVAIDKARAVSKLRRAAKKKNPKGYEHHKEETRRREAEISKSGRDIGTIPEVVNPERKESAKCNFRTFCEQYFPQTFNLAWSADHLKILAKVERAVLEGGLFALAMPRAGGKTSICERACLWAMMYGHHNFVCLIANTEKRSTELLDALKSELEVNELLLQDFPEVCYPIVKLDGIAHRCIGQLCNGKRTKIGWRADEIILPTIDGSQASGAIVRVAGLTGCIRGMKFMKPDGKSVRPSLVVLDDPQSDEALDIDTPIPTPNGFVRMGDLSVGDVVFDEKGQQCSITATSAVMEGHTCYRVELDDGMSVIADAGHKWETSNALQRTNLRRRVAVPIRSFVLTRPQCQPQPTRSIVTTEQISSTLLAEGGRNNHSIPMAGALHINFSHLPVPPYTLGVWLGDGHKRCGRITTADPSILDDIQRETALKIGSGYRPKSGGLAAAYTVHGLSHLLRAAGIIDRKHIPDPYLFASHNDRLALLQGLMDTDGSITLGTKGVKGQRCTFSNTNLDLIDGVLHLCRTLGIKARANRVKVHPRFPNAKTSWKVEFITSLPVFRLQRKRERIPTKTKPSTILRYVTSVVPVESRPVRCISVDSPSHLYLCGRALVPTHNSARSPSQCSYRESILAGAILGLAGPGKKISGIMPCTVVWPGDMADRILDRDKHPQWQGERMRMVYSFPKDEALWDQYAAIRADSLKRELGLERATAFYREHQTEMDAGAVVAWPERFNHDEASAIQNAMNLRLQNAQAFSAEYQNEPIIPDQTDQILTADQVLSKTNGHARGAVPPNATTVTMFVDLHKDVLYYAVCAWEEHFTGYVIDYGTFPDQKRPYFTLLESPYKLGDIYPGAGVDGAIGSGLEGLVKDFLGRDWMCGTGRMRIDRLLVDMGYKPAVAAQVKAKVGGAVMMLSKGVGVRASRKPIIEYVRKPGETVGHYWYVPNVSKTDQFPYVLMDVNYWKRTIHDGFALPLTDRGSISLYGTDSRRHEMLADHVARSEKWVEVVGPGGNVREWMALPTRPDNHLFDCLVGCAVAASIAGIKFAGQQVEKKARKRYTQDDLRRR